MEKTEIERNRESGRMGSKRQDVEEKDCVGRKNERKPRTRRFCLADFKMKEGRHAIWKDGRVCDVSSGRC